MHHRDTEFAEIGVFFDQELFTLRPRRLRGELSFDRYAKSGYCHEGLLSRTNQAAENGEDIGRGIEQ